MTNAQQAIDAPTTELQAVLDEARTACEAVVNEDNPCSTVRRVLPDASVLIINYHLEDGLTLEAFDGEENLSPIERQYFDPDQDNTLYDGTVIGPPFDTEIFGGDN